MQKTLVFGKTGDGVDVPIALDKSTNVITTINYAHHEIHGGSAFEVIYSVASLGAMGTPDDMITLTFTTPAGSKQAHMLFGAKGSAGWLMKFIEGSTGGGASPTGSIACLNKNRNSSQASVLSDLAGDAGKVSYDATLLTGGTTLWEEYLEGSSGPQAAGTGSGIRDEYILKASTTYQVSLYGTDTNPASIFLSWYEHTAKAAVA